MPTELMTKEKTNDEIIREILARMPGEEDTSTALITQAQADALQQQDIKQEEVVEIQAQEVQEAQAEPVLISESIQARAEQLAGLLGVSAGAYVGTQIGKEAVQLGVQYTAEKVMLDEQDGIIKKAAKKTMAMKFANIAADYAYPFVPGITGVIGGAMSSVAVKGMCKVSNQLYGKTYRWWYQENNERPAPKPSELRDDDFVIVEIDDKLEAGRKIKY